MDIDLVLALDDGNLCQFLAAAKRLELRPVAPVRLEDILSAEKRRQWRDEKGVVAFALRPLRADAPTVDILIDPPLDIDAALRRVEYRSILDLRLPVISVRDLISLKQQAGREQDLADIEHLRRLAENSGL